MNQRLQQMVHVQFMAIVAVLFAINAAGHFIRIVLISARIVAICASVQDLVSMFISAIVLAGLRRK